MNRKQAAGKTAVVLATSVGAWLCGLLAGNCWTTIPRVLVGLWLQMSKVLKSVDT